MLTPVPLANAMLALATALFTMSVSVRNPVFVFYSYWALVLAGQLVGAARKGGR